MKYQFVIFAVNMTILIIVYFFMREQPQKLKLLGATTLFAYFLAAILPYMLLSVPFKWVIFLYGIAIFMAMIALDKLLYKYELVMDVECDDNRLGVVPTAEPINDREISTIGITKPLDPLDTAIDLGANAVNFTLTNTEQNDIPEAVTATEAVEPQDNAANLEETCIEQTAVTVDEVQTAAVLSDTIMGTDDYEFSIESEIPGGNPADVESSHKEENALYYYEGDEGLNSERDINETDIEELIIAAFDAKGKDDFVRAIVLFEQVLNLNPAEEMAHLINTEIEIMLAKLQISVN